MDKNMTLEYIVIGCYFAFMIATGLAFRRFNRNFSDYFRSGCRGTWWLVGGSVFMASFTAWTFTGAAGVAFDAGITVAVIFFSNALGYVINWAVTAPLFRQMRAITFPEVVRQRFDTVTQQFYVWYGLLPGILMASLTLWGVAVFASTIFGFPLQALIIVLGLVVLIYSALGGSWSVMATDFLQALILMPMTLLVAWLSLREIGGIAGILQEIQAQGLPQMTALVDSAPGAKFSPGWAVAMLMFVLWSYNSVGSSVKYFSCKDGREARKAAALAAILMVLGAFLWFIPPIVAKLKFADLVFQQAQAVGIDNATKIAETSYAVIALKLLPHGLAGMIVVAMFAATMSSLSPAFNQFAAMITQDFYRPFLRPRSTDREIFIVGQITTVVVGLGIIGTALLLSKTKGGGLFDYMLLFGSLLGTPTVVPMFLALFVRKTPRWSALFTVCYCLVISLVAYLNSWSYARSVFSILGFGTLAFLATIPFWKYSTAEYKEKVGDFYRRMTTPVDFAKEVGKPNDPSQLKLVGYVSASIGFFLLFILLVPNPLSARLQILFVAGSILGFGGSMVLTGHIKERRLAVSAQSPPRELP